MKKIYALILALTMTVLLFSQSVWAENTSDAFRVLDFGYYDEVDAPLEELNANSVIKTKLALKKTGTKIERATLITCLLSDGEIIDINSVTEIFSEEPYERTLTTSINIPSDAVGELSVQSYLWGGWEEMHPLARWSDFDSENAGVYKLYVYDKLIDTFVPDSNDNNIVLPASTGANPKITAVCEDLGTKVTSEVSDNGDGSKKITITAKPRKGESRTYTLNYTVEEPKAEAQIVYDYTDGTTVRKTDDVSFASRKLLPPDYQYDDAGNVLDFGDDVMGYITTLYKDSNWGFRMLYVDVPDELMGAEILHLPSEMRNNPGINTPYDYSDMVVRLTLNKSATFYFPATKDTAALSGASISDVSAEVTYQAVVYGGDFKVVSNYKDKGISVQGNGSTRPGNQGTYRYEIFLEVPEGEESKTFEIPIVGTDSVTSYAGGQYGPLLWLKWAE